MYSSAGVNPFLTGRSWLSGWDVGHNIERQMVSLRFWDPRSNVGRTREKFANRWNLPCSLSVHAELYSHVSSIETNIMMTSSNGNIFRVTGHLCGEFTGPGEFPTQRPVTRSFDVFFDMRLNKRLSKQSWGWWLEMQFRPLWRHSSL